MGMRDYGFDDYGFIFTEEVIHLIAPHICEDYSERAWEENNSRYFMDEIYEKLGTEWVGNFTGELVSVSDDGKDDYSQPVWEGMETIYYISTRKYPSLFEAPYKDMNEIIDEFKQILSRYLPPNFDYRKYFKHIMGSYWG